MPVSRTRASREPDAALDIDRLGQIYEELPGSAEDPEGGELALASMLIIRSARVIASRVDDVLLPLGLSVPKFEILGLLIVAQGGEMSFAELKKAMYMHPASMGHTMRLLEAEGLVKRRQHDEDRRAFVAIITSKGRSVTRKGLEALHQVRFGLGGLSPAAARVVSGKLARFG